MVWRTGHVAFHTPSSVPTDYGIYLYRGGGWWWLLRLFEVSVPSVILCDNLRNEGLEDFTLCTWVLERTLLILGSEGQTKTVIELGCGRSNNDLNKARTRITGEQPNLVTGRPVNFMIADRPRSAIDGIAATDSASSDQWRMSISLLIATGALQSRVLLMDSMSSAEWSARCFQEVTHQPRLLH
ncbi:hypothetical protein J6590_048957 [Homalodisca vitripennis]|nr:hypothetical protein J6590_048957 [Homalodisca vitripennis]